jgi:hypothetical protein
VTDPFDPEDAPEGEQGLFPYPYMDGALQPDEIPEPPVSWWQHWRSAIIASVIFLLVLGGVVVVQGQTTSAPVTTTTSTEPPTECAEDAPVTCFTLNRVIQSGTRGPDVRRLQQRLKDLNFDPGRIDGLYGGDTMMAVWAFQSLVLKMTRDTVVDFVTPVMWDSMRGEVKITPRRQPGSPNHAEIYLPEQAMVIFKGERPILVTHISSGTGTEWCEEVVIDPGEDGNLNGKEPIKEGICGEAVTPGGIYYFYNRKLGLRESKLGTMWNPVYFNFGIAVHGAMNVPKEPASHGCIRIPIFISDYFPALVQYNDRVYVFDGVKEPEEYGSQSPPWDRKDPNYTTTTSSTSSTTIPTTTVPRSTTTTTTTTTTSPPPPVPSVAGSSAVVASQP